MRSRLEVRAREAAHNLGRFRAGVGHDSHSTQ